MGFKVGNRVMWVSQAGGFKTTKTGTVVAVVPPGHSGWSYAYNLGMNTRGMEKGSSRLEESYIIMRDDVVQRDNTLKPHKDKWRAYWPLVKNLEAMAQSKPEDEEMRGTMVLSMIRQHKEGLK